MNNGTDISETMMLNTFGDVVCGNMLADRTTGKNIYWATDSYDERGDGFRFYDEITIDKITGDNGMVVRPRSVKSKEEQTQRAKDKAEVFTPAWICNAQNNLIDEAWFGRPDVFNTPDPDDPKKWIDNNEKIDFANANGKTWKDYVADMRLEITCGEAPYIANRYDAVSGELNTDVIHRIGLLDRKLRVVSENTQRRDSWLMWGKIAMRSTCGFEWQGDNLLLAREALLYSYIEHFEAKFGERPDNDTLADVSYIISWNVWQMDGLKFGLPGHSPLEEEKNKGKQMDLFEVEEKKEPEPEERFCLMKDFFYRKPTAKNASDRIDVNKNGLSNSDFNDMEAPTCKFKDLTNNR